jgi:acylphosphatase
MEWARAHLFIDGRVQGVFYRTYTREVARTLRLNGWVKNLGDGRVEAVLEGEKQIIQQAIQKCYAGPPGARVSHIDIQWEPYTGEENSFHIHY